MFNVLGYVIFVAENHIRYIKTLMYAHLKNLEVNITLS